MSVSKACDATAQKIDLVLHRLMCLEAIITNELPEQKPVVEEALRLVLAAMRDLDSSASSLSDVEIPAKLLQWLDEGKDPDGFFKMLFDDTIWAGQVCYIRTRLEALPRIMGIATLVAVSVVSCCRELWFSFEN